jgi:hypothetical protein
MKTFEELTKTQQMEAVAFAKKTMRESIELGILSGSEFLTEKEISELAVAAAEDGQYDDEGEPYIDEMEVPYFFQGGCV